MDGHDSELEVCIVVDTGDAAEVEAEALEILGRRHSVGTIVVEAVGDEGDAAVDGVLELRPSTGSNAVLLQEADGDTIEGGGVCVKLKPVVTRASGHAVEVHHFERAIEHLGARIAGLLHFGDIGGAEGGLDRVTFAVTDVGNGGGRGVETPARHDGSVSDGRQEHCGAGDEGSFDVVWHGSFPRPSRRNVSTVWRESVLVVAARLP